jgi:hypothetical protein
MSMESINHRLETRPYFKLRLDWESQIVLPDSVQEKFAKALNREMPEKVLDSLRAFTPQQIERILQKIKHDCKGDSLCIQLKYQEYIKEDKEQYRKMYANDIMPNRMILTAANWQVKKAIPILEKAIGDKKYDQISVLMALAKLGNDSIKQILVERYTLPYILKTTTLDTINDEIFHGEDHWLTIKLFHEGFDVAMYLKSKEILLNLVDLIYIRGKDDSNIAISYTVSLFVGEFDKFYKFSNYKKLYNIWYGYADAIWNFEERKLNKKEKKELQTLLSTEYRNKIKAQLREWIIENVNFEEDIIEE